MVDVRKSSGRESMSQEQVMEMLKMHERLLYTILATIGIPLVIILIFYIEVCFCCCCSHHHSIIFLSFLFVCILVVLVVLSASCILVSFLCFCMVVSFKVCWFTYLFCCLFFCWSICLIVPCLHLSLFVCMFVCLFVYLFWSMLPILVGWLIGWFADLFVCLLIYYFFDSLLICQFVYLFVCAMLILSAPGDACLVLSSMRWLTFSYCTMLHIWSTYMNFISFYCCWQKRSAGTTLEIPPKQSGPSGHSSDHVNTVSSDEDGKRNESTNLSSFFYVYFFQTVNFYFFSRTEFTQIFNITCFKSLFYVTIGHAGK